MPIGEGPKDAGLSRQHLIEACEASLAACAPTTSTSYSLQARDAEYELIPATLDQALGILVWSPLAGGLLSGKYRRDAQPQEGRQLTDWDEPPWHQAKTAADRLSAADLPCSGRTSIRRGRP